MKLIGIVLIVFGLAALALGGFSYTKRETAVDLGPIQVETERHKTIPVQPIVGVLAVVGGIALVFADSKTRV